MKLKIPFYFSLTLPLPVPSFLSLLEAMPEISADVGAGSTAVMVLFMFYKCCWISPALT